jgi:ornithine cyclodeaminase/alanine dehydrogenase-like protein (mu-crystallin family)
LTASDIATLLADPATLHEALASQRDVLSAFSRSSNTVTENEPPEIQIPHRTTIATEGCTTLCMPSRVRGLEGSEENPGTGIGVKVVSVPREGDAGLPATTTLFEGKEGKLRAVVNARALTAVRNACGESLQVTFETKSAS